VLATGQNRGDVDQRDDLPEVGGVPGAEGDVEQFPAQLAGVAPGPALSEQLAVVGTEDDARLVRDGLPEGALRAASSSAISRR